MLSYSWSLMKVIMFSRQSTFFPSMCTMLLIFSTAHCQNVLELIESGCLPTGLYCKTHTSFTFCTKIGTDSLLIANEFFCPDGYICNSLTKYPCIASSTTTATVITEDGVIETATEGATESGTVTISEIETVTEIETVADAEAETTSTASSTTKKPVQPPNCVSQGRHPGPICSQYYDCVTKWIFFYQAVLKSCAEGLYFSESSRTCVDIELSGCID